MGLAPSRGSDVPVSATPAAGLSREPVVVGHSLGGLIVQRYLERHSPPAAALLAPVPPGGMLRQMVGLARGGMLTFGLPFTVEE